MEEIAVRVGYAQAGLQPHAIVDHPRIGQRAVGGQPHDLAADPQRLDGPDEAAQHVGQRPAMELDADVRKEARQRVVARIVAGRHD